MPTEKLEEKKPKFRTPEEQAARAAAKLARRKAKQEAKREAAREAGLLQLGANPKEIDRKEFEKLCEIQCTREEISSFFGVGDKTLTEWCKDTYGYDFETVFAEKRKAGLASLRRTQWKWAESNVVMAIFLGKNYLGQADSPDARLDEANLTKAKEILGGVESAID